MDRFAISTPGASVLIPPRADSLPIALSERSATRGAVYEGVSIATDVPTTNGALTINVKHLRAGALISRTVTLVKSATEMSVDV